jgi:hypothetical protein
MLAASLGLLEEVFLGGSIFASATLDDIFLATPFLVDSRLKRSAIVLGKFLGIGEITLLSTIAATGSLVVSPNLLPSLALCP